MYFIATFALSLDVNECDTNLDLNRCTEKNKCVNIKGGYECSCSLGYKLGKDQRTCTGKLIASKPNRNV